MFRKGKSAKLANKIGAFVLIISAGLIHRAKKLSKGVFDWKTFEKSINEGDIIPESIKRLFKDELFQMKQAPKTKSEFKPDVELFKLPALKHMHETEEYYEKLRVYESYRKYSIFMRLFK